MAQDLILSENKRVGRSHPTFIIAEIGQNHQGNTDTAKILIEAAKESGADCVKFQKTCINEKFNKAALERPYSNVNSWGETYGQHKAHLEFSEQQFIELKKFAADVGILFSATPMDLKSLKFLQNIDVPFIKIGSGDCNNLELLESAALTNLPLIISTGMQNLEAVNCAYTTISRHHKKFCLMHCISAYPTPVEDLNLSIIKLYQKKFPDIQVGYSGHEIGIDVSIAAVAIGAKVIERHITLSHNQKGSDHVCSLEPCEFKLMVQKIRTLETAMGVPVKRLLECEMPCYGKLRKSLVMAKYMFKGRHIHKHDVKIKVAEPSGIDPSCLDQIVGKTLKKDMKEDESLTEDCFE